MEAIDKAGYNGKCTVGLDVAASEFKKKDTPSGKVRCSLVASYFLACAPRRPPQA